MGLAITDGDYVCAEGLSEKIMALTFIKNEQMGEGASKSSINLRIGF